MMTQNSRLHQNASNQVPSQEGDPVEVAFKQALELGASELPQQMRYILALSQKAAIPQRNIPYPAQSINAVGARLGILVSQAETLDSTQITRLYREIQKLGRDTRLRLTLELAPLLPPFPDEQIHTFYKEAGQLPDPVLKSHILFALVPLLRQAQQTSKEGAAPEDEDDSYLGKVIRLAKALDNPETRTRSIGALSAYLPEARQQAIYRDILDEINHLDNDAHRANTITAMADHLPAALEAQILGCVKGIKSPVERVRSLTVLARVASEALKPQIHQQALKAIEAIPGEDERANSLVAYAPYLDAADEQKGFPESLRQALVIAIGLSRRQIRARALVALAPHLTLDLQREALAAVHSLPNESERANLLAELVPTLPPDLLIASLAVAHTMVQRDSRVWALAALAHHVPPNARSQTVKDALDATYGLKNAFERITAMVSLVDTLPTSALDEVFRSMLATAEQIENEPAKARAYSLIGSHLPPALLRKALKSAYQIKDPQQRLNAMLGLLARLPVGQRHDLLPAMLQIAKTMSADYKRARALVSVAPYLTPELTLQAMAVTEALEDPFDQASAYIALCQNLPPEQQRKTIEKAWALIGQIDEGYDRSNVLAAIRPYLSEVERAELPRVAFEVIDSIQDRYDQASAISILAPLFAEAHEEAASHMPEPSQNMLPSDFEVLKQALRNVFDIPHQALRVTTMQAGVRLWQALDPAAQYEMWQAIAPCFKQLPLADTLLCLNVLLPVLQQMYGAERQIDIADILSLG